MSAVLSHPSVVRVQAALQAAGVAGRIVELPGAARTARAAAEFLGCEIGQIANSLVFRGESSDRPLLAMSSGARRVDLKRLAALAGEPMGKANADFVREHTGFAIGGVAPVAHARSLRAFVEQSLAAYGEIWAAGGHPHTVFPLSFEELLRLTGGTPADFAERPAG